jgi:xylulokinase
MLYLPWLNGSQSPKANAAMRGGFLNVTLETTRAQMLRAVAEGVCFSLRWLLPAVERFCEREFDALHFVGGGAVSGEWAQTFADVMDRPVRQLADARYVNNRATAFLGFEQLGLVELQQIERLCPIERSYEPRPENRGLYDQLFGQFQAAWEQTRPIFEALNTP